MSLSSFRLYDQAFFAIARGQWGDVSLGAYTALLLRDSYDPALSATPSVADLLPHELADTDYQRQPLMGVSLQEIAGRLHFQSDPIDFGDPVTLNFVRYLVLARGDMATLASDAPLFGYQDLLTSGRPVETRAGRFLVSPPVQGWFVLERGELA